MVNCTSVYTGNDPSIFWYLRMLMTLLWRHRLPRLATSSTTNNSDCRQCLIIIKPPPTQLITRCKILTSDLCCFWCPTYLSIYLPTHLPTYPSTYLTTYLPTYLHTEQEIFFCESLLPTLLYLFFLPTYLLIICLVTEPSSGLTKLLCAVQNCWSI